MKTFTMITRHGSSKDNVSAYTLISSDYQTVTMTVNEIAAAISSEKIAVTNLGLCKKGLVSTNGAIDKYTLINTATNQVEGTARAVVLDRVEQDGKLLGYTVFTQNGILTELSVVDAAALAKKGLISNGKIRPTANGDIVSAIGGNYPLRTITMSKAPKGKVIGDVLYFGKIVGDPVEHVGVIISCTSAAEMSKIADIANKSNAKVIAAAVKVAGQSVRESLAIKRMGANSLYAVVELDILEKLIKAGAAVQNNIGKIIISASKRKEDDVEEATVELNNSWKIVDTQTVGIAEVDNAVKALTKKVIDTFGSVTISK